MHTFKITFPTVYGTRHGADNRSFEFSLCVSQNKKSRLVQLSNEVVDSNQLPLSFISIDQLTSFFYFLTIYCLKRAELGTIFCLPWTITWFGHVLNDYDTVVRLFDFFIFSHPWASMYLSAILVLHRASEIFLTPCDMPLLHQMLSNVKWLFLISYLELAFSYTILYFTFYKRTGPGQSTI